MNHDIYNHYGYVAWNDTDHCIDAYLCNDGVYFGRAYDYRTYDYRTYDCRYSEPLA